MLPVSDLLEVAREEATGAEVGARAPHRFAPGMSSPVIVWNVCRHCNMSCPHCYAAAAFRPSREDLDTGEAMRLLDDLVSCGVRIVIFSGGEPLLREDLFELAAHARQVGIAPQLSTNGVFIDEACAGRLAEAGFAYVGISIDGIESFNDEYRGMEGGHDAAVRGLRCAKAAGMRTGLRMTLTARNSEQIGDMLALAREVRADRFYVSHLLYSGRGRKMAAEDVGRVRVRALLHELFAAAEGMLDDGAATRVVTGSNDSDGPLLLRWIEARHGEGPAAPVRALLRERGGNSAGEKILNIDHRGHVHPDQFWRQETLGDVRRDAFATILQHPMRKLLTERSEHLTGRCGACDYRELCRGSHRERAIACSGGLWDPDPACVLEDGEIGVSA
jgi:radical SAM protein with 4Fe4S-binding SPASM domain